MIRPILLLFMAAILSSCASMNYPLPKCDGYSRRPLNRALWQWEDYSDLDQRHSDTNAVNALRIASYFDASKGPLAFAHLDVDASYRPCEG
ncbi:hypothetical protein I6F11_20495 [Ensifer sp. NBAIM29]|nr:hypothetical protein [Ensifer sp. NBAIM29]